MPSIGRNRENWDRSSAWEDHGEEWSAAWGSSASMWFGTILPRIEPFLPTDRLLEIACGHGRVSAFLLHHCQQYVGIDLAKSAIEFCEQRFGGFDHASFSVTDGSSLDMVDDASIDFVFSWDSLVHADEQAVCGYVSALARKLAHGAHAFLHHSNLRAFVDSASGELTVENNHWRDPSVSAQLVREFAANVGLECHSQELVQWGAEFYIDCFTVLRRPMAGEEMSGELRLFEHPSMATEMNHFKTLDAIYRNAHSR